MMGIPYEGRMPNFAEQDARVEDPDVIQQRLLREEQDQAYQDSLRVSPRFILPYFTKINLT